jgi:hypothetical protein
MEQYIIISQIKTVPKTSSLSFESDLSNIVSIINKIHKKDLISPFEILYPGEFQCIVSNLNNSINILFDIEECIIENNLPYKFKHVIYCHKTDTTNSKYSVFEKLGISLIDARNRLNAIKKTDSRFLIEASNELMSLNLNNLFLLYEDYIDSWHFKDFDYVKAFLNHMSYKEVAKAFKINISNGWRKEKKLKMKQYYTIKELILSET